MKYNPEIHHRKSIRLKEYDYSQAGYYFVTICTHRREHLFGQVNDGNMVINEIGNLVVKNLLDLPDRFKNMEIDANIIMPNHLHAIIILKEQKNVGLELALPKEEDNNKPKIQDRASSAPTIPKIVQVFKSLSTIEINKKRNISGVMVWQRNYYEHIIRNDKELFEIRKYIEYNPLNWKDDRYY